MISQTKIRSIFVIIDGRFSESFVIKVLAFVVRAWDGGIVGHILPFGNFVEFDGLVVRGLVLALNGGFLTLYLVSATSVVLGEGMVVVSTLSGGAFMNCLILAQEPLLSCSPYLLLDVDLLITALNFFFTY